MNKDKRIFFLHPILLFCWLFFLSFNGPKSPVTPECIKDFKEELTDIEENKEIDFNTIDCFQWDKIMIIAPAFSKKRIEQITKLKLPPNINYDWFKDGEGKQWHIGFISNNQIVNSFSVSRRHIDFNELKLSMKSKEDWFFLDKENCKLRTFYAKDLFVNNSKKGKKIISVRFQKKRACN